MMQTMTRNTADLMLSSGSLAINGGPPAVTREHPHEPWPPAPEDAETAELAAQRGLDINIRGKAGPVAALESRFVDFLQGQIRYCVSFNSGTSALLAAYFAAGIREGDEVIGPALTYHAALSPLHLLRARPVLADIDVATRCISGEEIVKLITPRTRAITVVHQWGHPADMDEIPRIAREHGLKLIEDCSHAHGSRYRSRLCGTFGDVAVFSLQTAKLIFAGEGGLLLTNDALIHDRATLLGHYRDRSRDELVDEQLRRFWVTGFGLKLRMSPFNAIVAKHSLAAYDRRKSGRHACLHYFTRGLEPFDFLVPNSPVGDVDMGAWYGFKPLYLPERLQGLPREQFVETLRAEGMEIDLPSGGYLGNLPLYQESVDPLFGNERPVSCAADHPHAKFVEQHAVSLPTFYRWPEDKPVIDQYLDAVRKLAQAVAKRV